jgi:hypothetical protein
MPSAAHEDLMGKVEEVEMAEILRARLKQAEVEVSI